jgi:RNA polymerase sigma factor (sigma-70 family)
MTAAVGGGLSRNPLLSFLDRQGSLLSAEQECLLARKVQRGCVRSRNELVERNLRLVFDLARRTRPRDEHDLFDRVQAGAAGLVRAAEKFDPDRGFRFSTYATWWIKQAISRDGDRSGAAPTDITMSSLDAPVTGESATAFGELLEDEHADNPEAAVELMDLREQVEQHLSLLEPLMRRAVRLRYGLDTGAPETIGTIASELDVDALHARRLACGGLRQLQRNTAEPVRVLA